MSRFTARTLIAGLAVAGVLLAGSGTAVGAEDRPPTDEHRAYDLSEDAVLPTGEQVSPRFKPRKWPVRTIKYWTDVPESYMWSVKTAIKSWDQTGLKMKIKLVKSRAKANATIRIDKSLPRISGLATLGYTPGQNWIRLSPRSIRGKDAELSLFRGIMAHIVAHEIGHNLGLGHNTKKKCALMQPVLYTDTCPPLDQERPGYYDCQIVDKPALAPMVRRYGGSKKLNSGRNCNLDPLPPDVTFTWSGGAEGGGPITVDWDPPANAPQGTQVDIVYHETCDFPLQWSIYGDPESLGERQARVPVGKGTWTQPASDVFGTGCYGAQAVNHSGAGRTVTTATLTSYDP